MDKIAAEFHHFARPILSDGTGHWWFLRGHILVLQSVVAHGSVEVVDRLNDTIDVTLSRHEESINVNGGLITIFDFRSVKGHDKEARTRWQERIRQRPKGYLQASRIVTNPNNVLLKMGLATLALIGELAGASIRPSRSIESALREFDLAGATHE